jgi:DNA-binding LytR/AlgR family response regulator
MKWLDLPLAPVSRPAFYRLSFFIGASVFFVLAVFQPFGTADFRHDAKYLILFGYFISIVAGCIAGWELLHASLLSRWRSGEIWQVRYEAVLMVFVFLTGASAAWVYQQVVFGLRPSLDSYVGFMFIALSTSIFPLAFHIVLRVVKAGNELEKAQLLQQQASTQASELTLVLRGDNRNETLTFLKSEVLFLQSADNYVQVYLQKDKAWQRVMLRGAISRMQEQINDPYFVQTHRSFIVNLRQPLRLEGKLPNYQLVFRQLPEGSLDPIPVSKNSVAEVREILSRLPV